MANLNNVKAYLALETTAGTTVTPTSAISIRDMPSLDKHYDRKPSEVILGNGMRQGEYTLDTDVKGSMSVSPRVNAGNGKLLKAHLGLEATPVQVAGLVSIRYIGASASCKLVVTATNITSNIGAFGAETADNGSGIAGFGISGVITLATYSTIGALVTYINTLTNYKAVLITGASGASSTTPGPVAITKTQAANRPAIITFQSTTTLDYAHTFTPDLSVNERPSLSIQKEGFQDNMLYGGVYANSLTMQGATKGFVQMAFDLIGMNETIGQTAIAGVSIPSNGDLVTQAGSFYFDKTAYSTVKDFSFKSANNLISDGYGMGSIDRAYVQKGLYEATGDFTVQLTAGSYAERAGLISMTQFSMQIILQGASLGNSLLETMIIDLPTVQVEDFQYTNNSSVLFAKILYRVFNQPSQYDAPVTVTIINTDTALYNS